MASGMSNPPTQSERQLREAALDWLFYNGANAGHYVVIDIRHPRPDAPGREGGVSRTPGAPDIVVLASKPKFGPYSTMVVPIPIAIELKVGNAKQSDDQILWQARWEAQGGVYIVIRDSQEMPSAFRALGLPVREEGSA